MKYITDNDIVLTYNAKVISCKFSVIIIMVIIMIIMVMIIIIIWIILMIVTTILARNITIGDNNKV